MVPDCEIDVCGDGGLKKKITQNAPEGATTPPDGADVYVHYVGTLLDGTVFDSSRERNQYFNFKLGKHQVIKGWDEGVATMKKGERAILTCTPDYAYGAAGAPPKIPPNATLQFDVELFHWIDGEDISGDGAVVKKVLTKGQGFKNPKDGEDVIVEIEGRRENGDVIFPKTNIETELGNDKLPKGVMMALKKMKRGEKCLVKCSKDYLNPWDDLLTDNNIVNESINFDVQLNAWSEVVIVNEGIKKIVHVSGGTMATPKENGSVTIIYQQLPDGISETRTFALWDGENESGVEQVLQGMTKGEKSTIIIQPSHRDNKNDSVLSILVEMVDIEQGKESYEYSPDEKVEEVKKMKEKATGFFKAGKYQLALHHYSRCVKLVETESKWQDGELEKEAKTLKLLCISNVAMCDLKLKKFKDVIDNCTKVLDMDKQNVKALFRRAQAYSETNELHPAKTDLERAQEIDSTNKSVINELSKVNKKIKVQDNKDKALYAKMFG